jgi:hypothetical protein
MIIALATWKRIHQDLSEHARRVFQQDNHMSWVSDNEMTKLCSRSGFRGASGRNAVKTPKKVAWNIGTTPSFDYRFASASLGSER